MTINFTMITMPINSSSIVFISCNFFSISMFFQIFGPDKHNIVGQTHQGKCECHVVSQQEES